MRCESIIDGLRFITLHITKFGEFTLYRYPISENPFGGTLQINTDLNILDIIVLLEQTPDVHVMIETIQLLEDYTGQRV